MASPHPRAEPFRAALDIETLGDLALRLGTARLAPGTGKTWERGVPGAWLAGLITDWRAFDPLILQARLDRLTHLRADIDGVTVHLVHAPGTGPDPLPLVLTHGWPSSFLEYLAVLPLLTDPAAHGGEPPVAEHIRHDRVPQLRDLFVDQATGRRRAGEAEARKRGQHDTERVPRVAAVRGRVGEQRQ